MSQEQSERQRFEETTLRDCQELNLPYDPNIKVFYDATATIRKLASIVDSKKRLRLGGLPKVTARTSIMATTGSSILTSMRAKKYRQEIYRGTGLGSVPGRPYVPFEVGTGFEESSAECERQLEEIFAHRKTMQNPEPTQTAGAVKMQELRLTGEVHCKAKRYERNIFYLDMTKEPKATIRGKSISVVLEASEGDPDLYMSIAEPPTEKEYVWRSVREGSDEILIHPHDPNYIYGMYYVAVSCASSDVIFKVYARFINTETADDLELFARTQLVTYQTLKSTIKDSEHRRRLCAGRNPEKYHFPLSICFHN